MKKLMIIASLVFLMSGYAPVFADDGGLNEFSGSVQTRQQEMIQGDQLSESLVAMINQAIGLMQGVTEKIENGSVEYDKNELTKVMKGLSSHIKDLSRIMSKGKATEKDMMKLRDKLAITESRLSMIN